MAGHRRTHDIQNVKEPVARIAIRQGVGKGFWACLLHRQTSFPETFVLVIAEAHAARRPALVYNDLGRKGGAKHLSMNDELNGARSSRRRTGLLQFSLFAGKLYFLNSVNEGADGGGMFAHVQPLLAILYNWWLAVLFAFGRCHPAFCSSSRLR